MTAAQESNLGQYIHQTGKGPACGIYEMEPATHDSLWSTALARDTQLATKVRNLAGAWHSGQIPDAEEMIGNLYYATAMARVKYKIIPASIPAADQIEALANYYKTYYNTAMGAATVPQVIANYRKYALAA